MGVAKCPIIPVIKSNQNKTIKRHFGLGIWDAKVDKIQFKEVEFLLIWKW